MKRYRFYFHYYRATDRMSVHWRGQCLQVRRIACYVPCETKWNARQPKLVLRGWATDVKVKADTAYIL